MSRTNRKPRRPQSTRFEQPPFAEVRSPLRPVDFVSEDQIETIHHASLKVLADIGLRVNSAVALDLYAAAGADVDHDRELVRFDPALVEEMLTDIPSEFTIHDWELLRLLGHATKERRRAPPRNQNPNPVSRSRS